MPFVNIRLVKELIADDPGGKKDRIGKAIVKAITETTGLADNDVWVVFEEVAARDWYVGPTDVQSIRAAKK
jgi:4-oxalocrotonate tautomerase